MWITRIGLDARGEVRLPNIAIDFHARGCEFFSTRRTHDLRVEFRAATVMKGHEVVAIGPHVVIAPLANRLNNTGEMLPGLGEGVLESEWLVLILDPRQHAGVFEGSESRGEDVSRGAGVKPDVVESASAEADLTNHQ